jgi:capsular exopolysaccharide synthesis family protein
MAATEQERQREIDRLLRESQATEVEAARSRLASAEAQMTGLQAKLEEMRKKVSEIAQLLRDYDGKKATLASVIARRDKAAAQLTEIEMRRRRPDFQGVEYALRPTTPEMVYPKFATVTTGSTVLLLGLALLVVFAKELLDQRIKSPADVRLLPGAELLGTVPDATEDPLGPARIETAVRSDPSGLIAESFRQIRTVILARADRRGYKTLMLVCPQGGCGSSTIASNLALSMAYNGKRVLVLEVNFRRPIQHQIFDAPAHPGLIEVLRGTTKLEDALVHKDEPRLDILPVGDAKDAPPELLDSPAFRQLLAGLESKYDIILIDAPPALITSESQHLARYVDAVAIVVRAMKDQRGTVGRMLRLFEGQRADVLGVVLNGVRSSAGGYFRKNYEEFYRYREAAGRPGRAVTGLRPAPAATPKNNGD